MRGVRDGIASPYSFTPPNSDTMIPLVQFPTQAYHPEYQRPYRSTLPHDLTTPLRHPTSNRLSTTTEAGGQAWEYFLDEDSSQTDWIWTGRIPGWRIIDMEQGTPVVNVPDIVLTRA